MYISLPKSSAPLLVSAPSHMKLITENNHAHLHKWRIRSRRRQLPSLHPSICFLCHPVHSHSIRLLRKHRASLVFQLITHILQDSRQISCLPWIHPLHLLIIRSRLRLAKLHLIQLIEIPLSRPLGLLQLHQIFLKITHIIHSILSSSILRYNMQEIWKCDNNPCSRLRHIHFIKYNNIYQATEIIVIYVLLHSTSEYDPCGINPYYIPGLHPRKEHSGQSPD